MRLPVAILTPLLFAAGLAAGQEKPAAAPEKRPAGRDRATDSSGRRLVTPATQQAIDHGLAWLAARQQEDGSFWSRSEYRHEVAVTALAGMAFLSDGNQPNRGRYGAQVAKAVDFIVSRGRPNGLIYDPDSSTYGPMYGHGFATLFLAEVYGTTPDARVRKTLAAAVKLIVASQNDEGGWRYQPDSNEADISVTVSQVMALRAARNCGIVVPKETIDRAVEYVKKCQNSDGGFMYQLTRRGESMFPRSAAGVVALQSAGIYEGREVEKGLAYLMRHLPQSNIYRYQTHSAYGHYYAAQAMWQAGGEEWERWYPAIRDELVGQQKENGRWPDQVCDEYGTAMALLVLQMPNDLLPIFQR